MNIIARQWLTPFVALCGLLCKITFVLALACPQAISEISLQIDERKLLTADGYHRLWVRLFFSTTYALDLEDKQQVAVRSGMIREMNFYEGLYPSCAKSRFCREVWAKNRKPMPEPKAEESSKQQDNKPVYYSGRGEQLAYKRHDAINDSYRDIQMKIYESNQWTIEKMPYFFSRGKSGFYIPGNPKSATLAGNNSLNDYSAPVPLPLSGSVMNYSFALLLLFGSYSRKIFKPSNNHYTENLKLVLEKNNEK